MSKLSQENICYQIDTGSNKDETLDVNVDDKPLKMNHSNLNSCIMNGKHSLIMESAPDGYIPIPLVGSFVIDGMKDLVSSQFCDITMTLYYLFESNDFEVLDCLGMKLREFDVDIVSYHLLQLMQLYIKTDVTSHFIYKYISYITEKNVRFSLLCSWMLDALIKDNVIVDKLANERIKLLNEEITINNVYNLKPTEDISNDSTLNYQSPNEKCVFIESKLFYSKLVKIGSFLLSTKTINRSAVLQMCIFKMNTIITEGIFVPWVTFPNHRILQISPYYATVLNSKERVPFMICIEVLEFIDDIGDDLKKLLPTKKCINSNSTNDNAESYFQLNDLNGYASSLLDDYSDENTKKTSNQYKNMNDTRNDPYHENITSIQQQETFKLPTTKFISHNKARSASNIISAQEIRNNLYNMNNIVSENPPIKRNSFVGHSANVKHHDFSDDSSHSINSSIMSLSKVNQAYEPWSDKIEHIKKMSPFSHLHGWNVYPVIVKCGDDLRQDLLAYQLLKKCQEVWEIEKTGLWIKPYEITIMSNDCGLIEAITDAISLHQLKKATKKSLIEYFESVYGPSNDDSFVNAQKNFIKSLAGYSIFQYVFRIKDRHNSNIMLDHDGHIIHIDFGFMLAITPKNLAFETSPFKMTNEYIDLMNGVDSDLFLYFRALMFHGLFALQKHMDKFIYLVQIMLDSNIPCVGSNQSVISALKSRFHANMPDEAFSQVVDSLINKSIRSITTRLYDRYQYFANGIL